MKDSVMEASSVGSCGAGNSSDRVALFPYRDAVKYSYRRTASISTYTHIVWSTLLFHYSLHYTLLRE
jgi:hypothetical protein